MKKYLVILLVVVFMFGLAACQPAVEEKVPESAGNEESGETAGTEVNAEEILMVAPFWRPCVGVAPMLCMQTKAVGETEWLNFYGGIDGFVYEPGYQYELKVNKENVENPPADGSSIRWTLVEVLDKSPVEMPQVDLTGTAWGLNTLQGWPPVEGSQITLVFDEEGRLGGTAGCNNYFSAYEHQGFAFNTTGPVGSTMMACEETVMDQETDYLQKLESMTHIQITGDTLLLVNENGLFMEFTRQ